MNNNKLTQLAPAVLPDTVLNRITARVLDELKIPGKVPSLVILAALKEVREQTVQAVARAASRK